MLVHGRRNTVISPLLSCHHRHIVSVLQCSSCICKEISFSCCWGRTKLNETRERERETTIVEIRSFRVDTAMKMGIHGFHIEIPCMDHFFWQQNSWATWYPKLKSFQIRTSTRIQTKSREITWFLAGISRDGPESFREENAGSRTLLLRPRRLLQTRPSCHG